MKDEVYYRYTKGKLRKIRNVDDSNEDEVIYYRPRLNRLVVSTTKHGVFIASPVSEKQITAAYKDIRKRYQENIKRTKTMF